MTKYELQRRYGELVGDLHWMKKKPVEFAATPDEIAAKKAEMAEIARMIEAGEYEPEINGHGNTVERGFHVCPICGKTGVDERYHFDFDCCGPKTGWLQFDTRQDAWYFGVWVHPEKREILSYAEGDVTLTKCPTPETYKAELVEMNEFYGEPPVVMSAYSAETGWTQVIGDRPMPE